MVDVKRDDLPTSVMRNSNCRVQERNGIATAGDGNGDDHRLR